MAAHAPSETDEHTATSTPAHTPAPRISNPPDNSSRQSTGIDDEDIEASAAKGGQPASKPTASTPNEKPDIEHTVVADDPRSWSSARKWTQLAMLSFGALIPTMAANVFFPAIDQIKSDLNASDAQISLSISLYILAQGSFPLVWAPTSEIIGRKPCFLLAMLIFSVCVGVAGAVRSIKAVIALRVLGAAGSAAMLSISAGSIADMYEPHERGVKVGIYYSAPLLGPALAPVIGGALTEAGGWQATFYAMAGLGGASCLSFFFFRETFRVERSLAWQTAKKRALTKAEESRQAQANRDVTYIGSCEADHASTRRPFWERWMRRSKPNAASTPREKLSGGAGTTVSPASSIRPHTPPEYREPADVELAPPVAPMAPSAAAQAVDEAARQEERAARMARVTTNATARSAKPAAIARAKSAGSARRVLTRDGQEIKFKPTLADVNPWSNFKHVLNQPHNVLSLIYNGLAFGSQYSLSYTAARTFAAAPYSYGPLLVGVVLLALGVGGIFGSVLGGKLSDLRLRRKGIELGHKAPAEERIKSSFLAMLLCPLAFIMYAWTVHQHVEIAAPVVSLVLIGFSTFWPYSTSLSYIVDSNVGGASGAVSCNSFFRGLTAFVASEVAGPLQDAVGDGALYTGWAVLITIGQVLITVVAFKATSWREDKLSAWAWLKFRGLRKRIARSR
ncbi:Synaptic vesicle transporter SVOP and related transporters (major facilitator superfamily) [Ceraceosorus bombacis]|uniref:Synaptic vesicle transporter SVOP and related transporters (Major facilitator superfamily) n=1 Tax=Ceraceosorus bombacis TaxID=401625 RepID=A0A0P1BEK9_9BASI|nr:Synaptic vesicle transporter SVOP and related transporters (major facilitator superfamily) [Ceraceosorus bombacis]